VGLLRSYFLLSRAVRARGIADLTIYQEQEDPIRWLETSLEVDYTASPELLVIALPSKRPDEAKLVLQALHDNLYSEALPKFDVQSRQERIDKIKAILDNHEPKLEGMRQDYKRTSMAVGTGVPLFAAIRDQVAHERVQNLLRDLDNLRRNLVLEIASSQEATNTGIKPTIPDVLVEGLLKDDQIYQRFQDELLGRTEALKRSEKSYQPGTGGFSLDTQRGEIEALKKRMKAWEDERRPQLIADLEKKAQFKARAEQLAAEDRIQLLKKQEKALNEEIGKREKELDQKGGDVLNLEQRKRDLDSMDAMVKSLKDFKDNLELEMNAPSRVKTLQLPYIRQAVPNVRRQMMIAGAAGSGALALVLLIIGYWEFLVRRIQSPDDVIHGLGWRLVGALPALPDRSGAGVGTNGDDARWQSMLTESVDGVRTMLLHAARTEGLRTVMVTSAVSGEGKTSLSCHLATSLARAGRKTLLIDCDLRSPAVHQLFELPAEPGFSELLRGQASLADVIRDTPARNLWVVPAGQYDAQTLQALAQDALRPTLDQMKEQFDFIVVDSSPVLPVVDALVIGQNVDVVIFSLLRDVSRIPTVYAAYQRLATLGVRMLGAVVNGVHRDAYGYSYRYYSKQAE
jgi:capsular exopolysaccharide synthesis family protein